MIKYVTYKGNIYSKVTERIKGLKALNRPYSLTTTEERLEMDNLTFWKVKAELIMLDTHEVYTGNAMRRYEKDHPFGSYPLEWAETIATARAIGKLGIGIDYSYACLEELGGLDTTQVSDRESAPKVELDEEFTKEDMKNAIGQNEKPEPDFEAIPVLPPEDFLTKDVRGNVDVIATESEPEPEPEPARELTKSEKLAKKLAEKKELSVKPPKPPKIVKIEPDLKPDRPTKTDKIDSALHAIESAVPDPIFGTLEPEPDPEPEPEPKTVVDQWPEFKQEDPELADIEIPEELQDEVVEDDEPIIELD